MTCDKLKPLIYSLRDLAYVDESSVKKHFGNPHNHAVYKATEVDALIADKDAEIARLKQKIEDVQESHYAEMVDAGMRERRMRRLLWHAIALFCARSCEYFSGIMSHCLMGQDDLYRRCEEKKNKYLHAMYKCRAKAEEYK